MSDRDRDEGGTPMTDRWTDRLSEYADGLLPPSERRDVEAHLAECEACAAVLADLREVVARARGLREFDASIGVGSDLWPGIEARIRDLPRPAARERAGVPRGGWAARRFTISMPQLAAVSVSLVALSAALFWFASDFAGRRMSARPAAGSGRVTAVGASSAPVEAALSEIAQLKKLLEQRKEEIDPETLRALRESLGSMESAVEDAGRALEADPGNPYLRAHVDELRERQLQLLRRAVALAGGAE
jgi:anti-sigma factor RsiW